MARSVTHGETLSIHFIKWIFKRRYWINIWYI